MTQSEDRKSLTLFGGDEKWSSDDWTSSDDRVRGGKSESFLDCSDKIGRFHGTLDIKTLGGAGFASQRTTGDDREWNLSPYAGVVIEVAKGDKKRYTFILKDELLAPNPENGREQSTVSYECDFDLPPDDSKDSKTASIFIPWRSLNATYRGKVKKDAKPIDTKKIKRISIMMRSFFGTQEGDFSLSIRSISAISKVPPPASTTSTTVAKDDRGLEEAIDGFETSDPYIHLNINLGFFKREIRLHRRLTYLFTGLLVLYMALRSDMAAGLFARAQRR